MIFSPDIVLIVAVSSIMLLAIGIIKTHVYVSDMKDKSNPANT